MYEPDLGLWRHPTSFSPSLGTHVILLLIILSLVVVVSRTPPSYRSYKLRVSLQVPTLVFFHPSSPPVSSLTQVYHLSEGRSIFSEPNIELTLPSGNFCLVSSAQSAGDRQNDSYVNTYFLLGPFLDRSSRSHPSDLLSHVRSLSFSGCTDVFSLVPSLTVIYSWVPGLVRPADLTWNLYSFQWYVPTKLFYSGRGTRFLLEDWERNRLSPWIFTPKVRVWFFIGIKKIFVRLSQY